MVSTPTVLTARDNVQLTLPAEERGAVARTIKAASLDADGEPGRGLTKARFTGNVDFLEKSATVDRDARSARLEVGLKRASARSTRRRSRAACGSRTRSSSAPRASVKYNVDTSALDMTGSEPGIPVPHVATDQIAVDATRIEVVLGGPTMHATGNVKSVLQPPKKSEKAIGQAGPETKIPSMLKQNQPVNVTAASLRYDGATSGATYEGMAQLWQADTSIKGDTVGIDSKTGDIRRLRLRRSRRRCSTSMDKDKKKERVRNMGTSKEFKYEDEAAPRHLHRRRAPERPVRRHHRREVRGVSEGVGQRARTRRGARCRQHPDACASRARKTTGTHLTYTSADEIYVVTGLPVAIVDQCGRETKGRTLTFHKATDTIQIDGNDRARTQTKGGGASNDKCQ